MRRDSGACQVMSKVDTPDVVDVSFIRAYRGVVTRPEHIERGPSPATTHPRRSGHGARVQARAYKQPARVGPTAMSSNQTFRAGPWNLAKPNLKNLIGFATVFG